MAREAEKKQDWGFYDKSNTRNNRASVGGNRSHYRQINHFTQKKVRFVDDIPTENIGKEGDIVFYENPSNFNKVEQYIKHNGQWINLSEGRPVSDSPRIRNFVKAKAG